MARYPFTVEPMRAWLAEQDAARSLEMHMRLRGQRDLVGVFAGTAAHLLGAGPSADFVRWISEAGPLLDRSTFQVKDSVGYRASDLEQDQNSDQVGGDRPTRHRLIIAEHLRDTEGLALLLPGADEVTLLVTSETLGKLNLAHYSVWPDVGHVTVEHVRTRITRFSQDYIDLHQATAGVADRVVQEVSGFPDLVRPDERATLAVGISDFVFFQALKIRAIEVLLEDQGFDHVVLALEDQRPDSEFIRLLGGVEGLMADSRLEVVSISRSMRSRKRFWSLLDQIDEPVAAPKPSKRRVPEERILEKFLADARLQADSIPMSRGSERPNVCVVTTDNSAYNSSTASTIVDLHRRFDVRVFQIGPQGSRLITELSDGGSLAPGTQVDLVAPRTDSCLVLADDLVRRVRDAREQNPGVRAHSPESAAEWALRSTLPRLALQAISIPLARSRALSYWFEAAQRAGSLPQAVIVTPQRDPEVSAVTYTARAVGVPTIALEPHAQDANYSRYIKVSADYYGVMSDYFRERAPIGFGIDARRTFTIGSSRQIAPRAYDPLAARDAMRCRFERETGLSFEARTTYLAFFCQPSDWDHMTKVWANVLEAARDTSSYVLLKTHPEESPSRTAKYVEQATASGMDTRVCSVSCDAASTVALADIVLTEYSAAAIDAALRQTPVVCVTDGDTPYPVDIPAIVGAPTAHSAEELGTIIRAFRSEPAPFRERARILIETESQFVEGPGPRLLRLVDDVIERGSAGLRSPSELPSSLFLDGPHPVFRV